MKVFSKVWPTVRAAKRGYIDGRPRKFRAFPPKSNEIDDEKAFETELELARFLSANPNWKSYFVNPDGKNGQHLTEVTS